MEVAEVSAFYAFENQLKTLCLTEFPCGVGSWRGNETHNEKGSILKNVDTHFTVTHKDYGAENEKTETLEELVKNKHSPWNLDYSWSNEARNLREIAVKSPWLIDDSYILSHFKTLRIIDKQVSEVDERLLHFRNLEELTLSSNSIQALNSRNLPRSLKVLELCANEVSDLFSLCVKPPLLRHLGLAYNRIEFIDDYITGDYWPELLSLDLSRNNLSDLMEVVRKLATLPKLRNLVLQGNPLSLVPGYRGFTIDTLKALSYLDDVGISADERHHFKGLAKKKEHILDEAKLIFGVEFIKNVPMPEELKNPEEQPEFPQVIRNYYAQFKFLEDTSSKPEIFQITHDDFGTEPTERAMSEDFSHSAKSDKHRSVGGSSMADHGLDIEKNVNFAAETETIIQSEPPEINTDRKTPDNQDNQDNVEKAPFELTDLQSTKVNWSEEMVINWSMLVVRDDLLKLRDFFIQGMEVQVMEEKILAYPKEDFANPDGISPAGSQRSGKGDKKDKNKKDDKGKGDDKGKKDGKGKGKKKEPEIELHYMPPEYTCLSTFHVPLEDFLHGEYMFENVFVEPSSDATQVTTPVSVNKSDGGKKPREKSADRKDKDKKDKPKSPKGKEKDVKGDKSKQNVKDKKDSTAEGGGEEEDLPPPPLELQVRVELLHWSTARDALRQDDENGEDKTENNV